MTDLETVRALRHYEPDPTPPTAEHYERRIGMLRESVTDRDKRLTATVATVRRLEQNLRTAIVQRDEARLDVLVFSFVSAIVACGFTAIVAAIVP